MEEVKVYKTSDGVLWEDKKDAIEAESFLKFQKGLEHMEAHWRVEDFIEDNFDNLFELMKERAKNK